MCRRRMKAALQMVPSMKRTVRQSLLLLPDEETLLILDCSWVDLLCHSRLVFTWKAPSARQTKATCPGMAIR